MSNLIFVDDPDDIYIHKNLSGKMEELIISEKIEEENNEDYSISNKNYDKIVLSIDIGILHLGVSIGLVDTEFNLLEITYVDLINITEYTHDKELENVDCKLKHTKTIADWIEHVFHEHRPIFEEADYILVERQPPSGLVAIEQLIFYRWREKCFIISPRSMHKFYDIGCYDYEQRKEKTMYIATKFYEWHDRAIENYNKYERKHDITDSICLMGFWLNRMKTKFLEKKRKDRLKNIKLSKHNMSINDWFEQFRYFG